MGLIVLRLLRLSSHIPENKTDVPRSPRLIPVRKPHQPSEPQMRRAQVSLLTTQATPSSAAGRLDVQHSNLPGPRLSCLLPRTLGGRATPRSYPHPVPSVDNRCWPRSPFPGLVERGFSTWPSTSLRARPAQARAD